MSKRKQVKEDSDSDSEIPSLIDVSFEFFDPNPEVDYHALSRLLRQLFQADAQLFHLPELTDLVLSQPLVGTTIKTDGRESDPLAVLTVLNMRVHNEHPSIQALSSYVLEKSAPDQAFHSALTSLLAPDAPTDVGLILCERLINMPVQVIPPAYRMLASEIQWALEDNEPYAFSHYLFLSRVYKLTDEEEEDMRVSARGNKRPRANVPAFSNPRAGGGGVYPFHPEDEYILAAASHSFDYPFSSAPAGPREKDAFGLDMGGRVMLVPTERMGELIEKMGEVYKVPEGGAVGARMDEE